MAIVTLRKTRETRVRAGHPWIYNSEIEKVEGDFTPGDVAEVHNFRGGYIGRGFYNPNSVISLRMLTTKDEVCDREFFKKRIQDAWNYRRALCDPGSCRLIYSESDFLPGLVVDKFGDYLCVQILSMGIERIRDMLVELLVEIVAPKGIYERSDVPVRRHEGLELRDGPSVGRGAARGWTCGKTGMLFGVDLISRSENRLFPGPEAESRRHRPAVCRDARVLDCFCHNGSFSLQRRQIRRNKACWAWIFPKTRWRSPGRTPRRNGLENVTLRSPQLLRSPARPVRCGRKVRPGNSGSPRLYQVQKHRARGAAWI